MDDLVTWLRAQLDEDERVANNARGILGVTNAWWKWEDLKQRFPDITRADAMHIANHGWDRVLREVEAKRRILKRHHRRGGIWANDRIYANACEGCGYTGDCDDPRTEDINECPELRDAALPFSDRSGYRSEWAP